MRVQLKIEGGIAFFPGLRKPVVIDTDHLPASEAAELKRLVQATRFFDLPETVSPPPPGAADYQQYVITVEDEGRQHSVRLTDPVENPAMQALLSYLQARR
ncbi:MAG: hypothetical protein IMW89_11290 [Ktedonobacteraceae bacterium]|nr:hypothetical protein [Ktedonobacteraceae bacterium]